MEACEKANTKRVKLMDRESSCGRMAQLLEESIKKAKSEDTGCLSGETELTTREKWKMINYEALEPCDFQMAVITKAISTIAKWMVKEHSLGQMENKYIGSYADGKKHGKGKLILPNGEEYFGRWVDGKIDGEVQYKDSKGHKNKKIMDKGMFKKQVTKLV
jgi:hypothetical protein